MDYTCSILDVHDVCFTLMLYLRLRWMRPIRILWRFPRALRSPPLDPLEQHRQLRRAQWNGSVLHLRPDELPIGQALLSDFIVHLYQLDTRIFGTYARLSFLRSAARSTSRSHRLQCLIGGFGLEISYRNACASYA